MVKSSDNDATEAKIGRDSGDEAEHEPGMRVGEEFQAVIPDTTQVSPEDDGKPEPVQVWAPSPSVADTKLDEYLRVSKDKHGYNIEQSLGMLYWHKYNIDRSLEDLQNFTPLPDEWSMEDKVIFEQSFSSYGKSFVKIKAQLPDKSIGSLVKYYYSWKKIRNRTSLMDRQARRLSAQKHPGNFSMAFSDNESDAPDDDTSDSDFEPEKESGSRVNNGKTKNSLLPQQSNSMIPNDPTRLNSSNPETCVGCSASTTQLQRTPKGLLCQQCFQFWRQTNVMRPKVTILQGNNASQLFKGSQGKLKKKAPKGMMLTHEGLINVSQMHGDSHVRPLEVDLINLRRQIQTRKQSLEQQKQVLHCDADKFRLGDVSSKLNLRWTNEELQLAVQCVRKYGKDFNAMAEVLANKNASQCKNFFVNQRRRLNLNGVLEEYEKEHSLPYSDKTIDSWDNGGDENMSANDGDPSLSPVSGAGQLDARATPPAVNGVGGQQHLSLTAKQTDNAQLPNHGSPTNIAISSTPSHPPPLIKPIASTQSG